jgi:hypothetical protein
VAVTPATAVARADVEEVVGTEQQQAAVVVALPVGHPQHQPRRAGVGALAVRAPVLDDPLVARPVGEVHVEAARAGVVGGEREREQPLLAPGGHLGADVEKRGAPQPPADQHPDPAGLLDDEHAPAVAGRCRDVQGRLEAADALERDAPALRRGRGGLPPRGRGVRGARAGRPPVVARSAGGDERARGEDDGSRAPHGR